MTSTAVELHTTFEVQLMNLIEQATQIARARDESVTRLSQLEQSLANARKENENMKREKAEERETFHAKERKLVDEYNATVAQMEKCKAQVEELNAKCEAYRTHNVSLEASLAQFQSTMHSHAGNGSSQLGGTNRFSHLMSKEALEQISTLQDHAARIESKVSTISSSVVVAETKMAEMGRLLFNANEALANAKQQLESVRTANREAGLRIRRDAVTISSLSLDVENLNEQVKRLREETTCLNQQRRVLENELEHTKLTIASSLLSSLPKDALTLPKKPEIGTSGSDSSLADYKANVEVASNDLNDAMSKNPSSELNESTDHTLVMVQVKQDAEEHLPADQSLLALTSAPFEG